MLMPYRNMLALITLLLAASAAATPTKRGLAGWGYATFYDDNACTSNPTEAISMGNTGCVANMVGRNSIYIQPGFNTVTSALSMVWSPGTECNCQNDCAPVANNGNNDYCWDLNGHADAQSFRFIHQGCASNNC